MVERSGTMEGVPVPVFAWNFLLCEVGTGRLGESAPGAFDETVGAISFGRGYNGLGFVVVDPS